MGMGTFLAMLMGVSVFTGLFTEAIKKILDEFGKKYSSNLLAGGVAATLAVLCSVGYAIMADMKPDVKQVVYLVALLLLSWLSAMVGYDKIMQAIGQLLTKKGD